MANSNSLISYYAQNRAEVDLLQDVEGLFVLSFMERCHIVSRSHLQSELLWPADRFERVVQRLTGLGALQSSTDVGQVDELSVTLLGRKAVSVLKGASSTEEGHRRHAQDLASELFRSGMILGQNPHSVDQAVEAYSRAVELDPNFPGALLNLGTIFFSRAQYEKASEYYKRALEAKPSYAKAHFNLGLLYHQRGNNSLAEIHYKSAIGWAPEYSDPYYNLAVLLEENHRPRAAISYWRNYLMLDHESEWAYIARERLNVSREPDERKVVTTVQEYAGSERHPEIAI